MTTRISIADLSPDLRRRLKLGEVSHANGKRLRRATESVESADESLFAHHCRCYKLPEVRREYLFAKSIGRLWRFDHAWPEYKVAVEEEGLVPVRARDGSVLAGGRHATFPGFRGDCVKYAAAAIMGWHVLRFEQTLIENGTAIDMTMDLLKAKGWKP